MHPCSVLNGENDWCIIAYVCSVTTYVDKMKLNEI